MINEPHGDIRTMAATVRQFYDAFIMQGFTEDQAMELTVMMWEISAKASQ